MDDTQLCFDLGGRDIKTMDADTHCFVWYEPGGGVYLGILALLGAERTYRREYASSVGRGLSLS